MAARAVAPPLSVMPAGGSGVLGAPQRRRIEEADVFSPQGSLFHRPHHRIFASDKCRGPRGGSHLTFGGPYDGLMFLSLPFAKKRKKKKKEGA